MKKTFSKILALTALILIVLNPHTTQANELSLACRLTDNQVWNLTGTVDGAAPQISLYRGSTYAQRFNASNGRVTIKDTQFAASTKSEIFTLYNGVDSSAPFLTAIDCSPKTEATSQPSPPTTTTQAPITSNTNPVVAQTTAQTEPTPTTGETTPDRTEDTKKENNEASKSLATTTKNQLSLSKGALTALLLGVGLLALYMIITGWIVFKKAGYPGWAALVPIYNSWITYKIGGRPGWWALVMLIPVINLLALVIFLLACIEIAKRFGKGPTFGILGLFVFSLIGWSILAFGKAQYANPDIAPQMTDQLQNPAIQSGSFA